MDSWTVGYQFALLLLGAGAGVGVAVKSVMIRYGQWRKRTTRYNLRKTYAVDNMITKLMDDLLQRTGAVRVHLYRFHNGASFYDGSAIKRFSCSYESAATGVSREVLSFQSIPISLVPAFQALLLQGKPHINRTADVQPGHFKARLEDLGVQATCLMPLILNKLIVGAVCLHYNTEQCTGRDRGCKWFGEACNGDTSYCALVEHFAALLEMELAKDC